MKSPALCSRRFHKESRAAADWSSHYHRHTALHTKLHFKNQRNHDIFKKKSKKTSQAISYFHIFDKFHFFSFYD